MLKAKNCFFIEYPQMHNDKIRYGTLELHDYTDIKPEWKLILHGEVISVPEGFTYDWDQDIKIGDRIYFKYNVANPNNITEIDGKKYLRVDAFGIFAYVRDGKIYPFGDYSLSKAMFEEHDTVEVEGKEVKGKMVGGLFLVKDIQHDKRLTKIAYTNSDDFSAGDTVLMDRSCDQEYIVEGQKFFVIENRDILGVWIEED